VRGVHGRELVHPKGCVGSTPARSKVDAQSKTIVIYGI